MFLRQRIHVMIKRYFINASTLIDYRWRLLILIFSNEFHGKNLGEQKHTKNNPVYFMKLKKSKQKLQNFSRSFVFLLKLKQILKKLELNKILD